MKRHLFTLVLAACSIAVAAPSALAGEPFTVGQGTEPHIFVEPGSGTAHVLWSDYDADSLQYWTGWQLAHTNRRLERTAAAG